MGKQRQNGVDGAIALLNALATCGTPTLRRQEAQEITGVPRTSLHRITRILTEAGLTCAPRGQIAIGDKASFLREAYARQVHADYQRRSLRDTSVRNGFPQIVTGYAPKAPALHLGPARPRNRRRFHIGFSNTSLANAWRLALVHAIEYGAGGLNETIDRLSIRHADDDADLQARQIRALVGDGVDGLLVSAGNSPLVAAELTRAVALGVRVVLVDRAIDGFGGFDSFVNSSDQFIGHMTALWLAEILQGQGRILLLPGKQGAAPSVSRLKAALAVFRRFPGLRIAASHWTDWRPDIARAVVENHLRGGARPFDGVWSDSGLQGVGSLQAYLAAGFFAGEFPPHTGGDLNQVYKLALQNRVRMVAVDFPPAMGLVAVETLYAALRGVPVPRSISLRSDIIVTKGDCTASVRSGKLVEDHVRWDLPDQLILQSGISRAYDPHQFRVRYPGNSYNRSAAQLARQSGRGAT